MLGLKEGRALYLIDPRAAERQASGSAACRCPMRMKGASLSHDDQRVNWQRCYYFQPWQMDLQTGKVQLGHYPTYGGHEIFGRDCVVGRYGTMMLTHRLGLLPCDEQRADEVRIWSNWATDVPSDYGRLSDDDRWLVTNGTEGAVAGKRLLIDGRETGTVLQVVHDFTSRNSWDSNTYSRISPDATKIAYMCDMLGDTDVYVALTRRPEAPRNLTLAARRRARPSALGAAVRRTRDRRLQRVSQSRKRSGIPAGEPGANRGLRVRGHAAAGPGVLCRGSGRAFRAWKACTRQKPTRGKRPTYRVYADLEEGQLSPPLRQHFDGRCSNFRCVRVWKESAQEKTGQAALTISIPAAGSYYVWMRGRGQGEFKCSTSRSQRDGADQLG